MFLGFFIMFYIGEFNGIIVVEIMVNVIFDRGFY